MYAMKLPRGVFPAKEHYCYRELVFLVGHQTFYILDFAQQVAKMN